MKEPDHACENVNTKGGKPARGEEGCSTPIIGVKKKSKAVRGKEKFHILRRVKR